MHQVVYCNKLKNKYTLIPRSPRLFYIGPINIKGHLNLRDSYPNSYNYLSILCILCLAACGAAGHLSALYSAGQLPIRTI